MKLKIIFGLGGPVKTREWHRDIDEFYKVLSLGGIRHSLANYRPDANKEFDYIIHFHRLDRIDPSDLPIQSWEELNDGWGYVCECGALYGSTPNSHNTWCPKYTKY